MQRRLHEKQKGGGKLFIFMKSFCLAIFKNRRGKHFFDAKKCHKLSFFAPNIQKIGSFGCAFVSFAATSFCSDVLLCKFCVMLLPGKYTFSEIFCLVTCSRQKQEPLALSNQIIDAKKKNVVVNTAISCSDGNYVVQYFYRHMLEILTIHACQRY